MPMRKQEERVSANGEVLKKGPWTVEEDALLIEYVKRNGERQWNAVQNMGLRRCGKSCRLRWMNHLRPGLKKGPFSDEEEKIVLDLHRKLGNKWSRIAAKLPGRTDNEVKNFWNTKIKGRMKNDSLQILLRNGNPDSVLPPIINFQAPLFAPMNMDPNQNPNPDPFLNLSTTLCFSHPANASSSELEMNLMARDLIFHQSAPELGFSVSDELMSLYQNSDPFPGNNFLGFETNPTSVSDELVSLYQNSDPFPGNNFLGLETNTTSDQVNTLPYAGGQASYGIQSADGEPEMIETFHYGDFSEYLLGDEGHDYYSSLLGVESETAMPDEGNQNLNNGGEMPSLVVGNDGSITDATISSTGGISLSESPGKQLLEAELESMDDELSSLLDTFSACELPPDWYQTSGGDTLLDSTLTSYNPPYHDPYTLSSGPATSSGAGHAFEN